MSDVIEAGGHAYWVPISLEIDPDEVQQQLLDRFGREESTADNAALLTGAARQLLDANAAAGPGMVNVGAWGLLREPDALVVRAIASLQYVVLPEDITADDVVRHLAGEEPLFEDPQVQPIETRSGDAVSARLRPMLDDAGTTQVHEAAAVLWHRPEVSAWFILSTYSTDLVEAREVGDRLDELAAGIEGL